MAEGKPAGALDAAAGDEHPHSRAARAEEGKLAVELPTPEGGSSAVATTKQWSQDLAARQSLPWLRVVVSYM